MPNQGRLKVDIFVHFGTDILFNTLYVLVNIKLAFGKNINIWRESKYVFTKSYLLWRKCEELWIG